MSDRRLIEVNLPLYEISRLSAKQKQGVRTGQIKALHTWWARRPTAAARAAVLTTLLAAPEDEKEREDLEQFVARACTWDASLNRRIIGKARSLIADQFSGAPPKILDPFAGGGIIPLEALRLGCETHALELNPVAHLIQLATLVYPQEFGSGSGEDLAPEELLNGETTQSKNRLAADVERWGNWVLDQARIEIGEFYENPVGSEAIVAYLWARTVDCPNPSCGATVPLVKQFWLRRKSNREKVALKPVVDWEAQAISFKIVRGAEIPDDFDPSEGTTSRGSATCPVCAQGIDAEYVRREGRARRMGETPLAVITTAGYGHGKDYRAFTEQDVANFRAARERLQQVVASRESRHSLLPNEPIPRERARGNSGFRILLYGLTRWSHVFNPRQALALIIFATSVRKARKRVLEETGDEQYARAVTTFLALTLDKLAATCCSLARWFNHLEAICPGVSSQNHLPMNWDYLEANPFGGISRDWTNELSGVVDVIRHSSETSASPAVVQQGTATSLPYPDSYFDAVITDPPYYDNVAYADLSDFFYVWLKRTIGDAYPELFRSPLTPKATEIIQEPERHEDATRFYEQEMTKSFREIHRVLRSGGRCALMFAHKSTAAWETLIAGLLEAGLVTSASWPLHTEMGTRLMAQGSAALASSILLICNKRTPEAGVGYYDQVRSDLETRIRERLDFFWQQGIRGSDFFISAIGPALEVFGQYEEVRHLSGEPVTVSEFLHEVRSIVTDYALSQVLRDGKVGAVDPATRFYVIWRWAYGNNDVPFDDGRVLAQALGAEIDDLMNRTDLLRGRKNLRLWKIKARVQRNEDLGEPKGGVPAPLIDVLQRACVLWEREERAALSEFLNRALMGRDETFWSVAQSLSEILPDGDKEKQLLQGLLVSQDRLPDAPRQRRMFDGA